MKTAKLLKRVTACILALVMVITSYAAPINADEKTDTKYSITNFGASEVSVTLEHVDGNGQRIYSDDIIKLKPGQMISGYNKAINWEVKKVFFVRDGKEYEVPDIDNVSIVSDTTLKICYEAKKQELSGKTTFYDYLVRPYDDNGNPQIKNSINTDSNYPKDSKRNNRFEIGTTGQNFSENRYDTTINRKKINDYTSGTGDKAKKTGIIKGLSEDYTDVLFSVDEPGCFSSETKAGKTIISDNTLTFSQNGDSYTLKEVKDSSGKKLSDAGNNFFPLDGASSNTKDYGYGDAHNYYFGMRYDIDFTLGDYVGPLNYSFTGDDDLWVILDGKTVVIDLGGIHDALTGSANLWDYLGLKQGTGATNEAQKKQIHRLTILYMERGGNESNCQMNFTIPSARIVEPGKTIIKKSDMLNVAKSAKLVNWDDRTYEITMNAYCRLDETIVTGDEKAEGITDAVVTDYIATEFDLLDDNGNVINQNSDGIKNGIQLANGAKAFYDEKNQMMYVIWENQSIPYSNDGSECWSNNISVRAKPGFWGGNNIATNDGEMSGVTIIDTDGKTVLKKFNQPKVNVKIRFNITDAENTIFLGQYVSTDPKILDNMTVKNLYSDTADTIRYSNLGESGFVWDWYDSDVILDEHKTDLDKMASDKATEIKDKLYYLNVSYNAGAATDESNTNSTIDGTVYVNGTAENGYVVAADNIGIYTTHVIDGTLTIEKCFKGSFLDGLGYSDRERELIEAKQTAVFTVYQYDCSTALSDIRSKKAKPVNSFSVTITDKESKDNKVTVTGLSEGIYSIEENTDWSWKYKLLSIKESQKADGLNDDTGDGIFYIGPEHAKNGVVFTNALDEAMKKIYSDTTNVLNIFTNK